MTDARLVPRSEPLPAPLTAEEWRACLSDPWWRLTSGVLYKIMIKGEDSDDGMIHVKPFLPNINQLLFMTTMHYRNVILKARQLGFTTLAAILGLDRALFVPDQRCGIIAHAKDDAIVILRDKVRFAYDHLPEQLRRTMALKSANKSELLFSHNNSSIRVSTSMRSGTIHFLHISEMGKISARKPQHSAEIVAGSLPAVPATGITTIESTAEGQSGDFFEISTRAEAMSELGHELADAEYKFFFFPWFMDKGYVADPKGVKISAAQHEYFDGLEERLGINLTMPQRAWYVLTLENVFHGDEDKMKQEMPSTTEECWSKSIKGTYYPTQLKAARIQGRIGKVPYIPSLPVHTFWDIGSTDGTGIWFGQQVGLAMHFIKYFEGWGEPYAHYVNEMRRTGWVYGRNKLPHDATQERQMAHTIGSPLKMLQELAPDLSWDIVPRVHDFQAGIEITRNRFSEAWFDEVGCKEGLIHLQLYHKRFNTRLGTFIDEPEKYDGHSEAADAFRQWAQGFTPLHATEKQRRGGRRATGTTA